ncbi:hypothetical protein H0H87_006025, partial [Tephrocybe sp. NHM501043]
VYSNGLSEEILGKAIKKFDLPREEIVVMTKIFYTVCREPGGLIYGSMNPDDQRYTNQYGLGRKACHRFDSNTPVSETMQALHDVVQLGL